MRSDVLTKELLDLRDRINKLSNEQRDILLDFVDPLPEPQVTQPAPKKKRKSSGKSQRASNMAATLNRNLSQQRAQVKCTYVMNADESDGHACEGVEGDPIHDKSMGYAGYHEFVPPGAQAAGAGD